MTTSSRGWIGRRVLCDVKEGRVVPDRLLGYFLFMLARVLQGVAVLHIKAGLPGCLPPTPPGSDNDSSPFKRDKPDDEVPRDLWKVTVTSADERRVISGRKRGPPPKA